VAAGKAIDGFLKHIADWLKSDSGKKFLHWMEVDGPKAIKTFGQDMWTAAQVVGRVFDFMVNAGKTWWKNFQTIVHAVMTIWSNGVRGFEQLAQHIVFAYHSLVTGFTQAGHLIETTWDATWKAVTGVLQAAWGVISGIFSAIESAASAVAGALSSVGSAFSGVSSLGSAVGGFLGKFGFAGGGITGAASGGPRSGLTLVGERGPELLRLPAGSQVYNNGQTQQMLGAGGGPQMVVLQVAPGGGSAFEQFMVQAIRQWVRTKGGGNVQSAFGIAGA
jgi:phage-related protein